MLFRSGLQVEIVGGEFLDEFPGGERARVRIGDQVHAERHRVNGLRTDFEGAVGVAVRRDERLADLRDQRRIASQFCRRMRVSPVARHTV